MVLKIYQISQEDTFAGFFLNKVAANQACNFTKIRLQHGCFLVKFVVMSASRKWHLFEFDSVT